MFHIPYYFLNVKENILVMLDEALYRSQSEYLETRRLKQEAEPTNYIPAASGTGQQPLDTPPSDELDENEEED